MPDQHVREVFEALLAGHPMLETVLKHMSSNLNHRRQFLERPVPVLLNGCLDELNEDVKATDSIRVRLSGL